MKKGTIIFALGLLVVYLIYKNAQKNKGTSGGNGLIDTWTAPEDLYADDFATGDSYFVPMGSIVKEYDKYFEIITSDTNETLTISKA